MGLACVRQAVADQLACGLLEWTVYPQMVNMPATPALVILNGSASARDGFTTRSASYPLRILAVVSMTDLPSAQTHIDSLRERGSDTSVYDLLEADRTLGGAAQTLIPGDISEDQPITIGDRGMFFGCWFEIVVTPTFG